MALPPLSWLLRLAAICHLTMLLAGQHHGVKKCSITCSGKISAEIPEHLLMSYRQNRRSCGKPAIILGMAMFAYQSLQGCPHKIAGDMAEGLRYVPRSCGSNSYVLVPV
uniref:C-X3-C motif chemokine ligand 1 n=1 Tax=Rousettus aegyptiacus TaxID=9407 RepID=A0A7J8CF93_ROUAE|nr:C-X3-C motif chemokine ligand 1 [Rousettus aegyptiacus]